MSFYLLFSRQNESTTSLRNESGYTQTPCNNLVIDHSKNNLLVNLPTKTDIIEKNNINCSTNSSSGSSTATTVSTVIQNGTLPRNGTLCKKVYL